MASPTNTPRPVGPQLEKLLTNFSEDVQRLATTIRQIVFTVMPDAEEVLDHRAHLVGFGFGPRYSDFICTLILSGEGVKLGIVHGAELPDPDGLMCGSGRVHRHIPINKVVDATAPGVLRLLERALQSWHDRQGRNS